MTERVPAKHLTAAPLRDLLLRLRRHAPLRCPVRLIQKRGVLWGDEYVLGVTSYRRRWVRGRWRIASFRIVVDSRLPHGEKWEVVLHEYAHCLDRQDRPVCKGDVHDCRWGQHFSRAFRASLNKE